MSVCVCVCVCVCVERLSLHEGTKHARSGVVCVRPLSITFMSTTLKFLHAHHEFHILGDLSIMFTPPHTLPTSSSQGAPKLAPLASCAVMAEMTSSLAWPQMAGPQLPT